MTEKAKKKSKKQKAIDLLKRVVLELADAVDWTVDLLTGEGSELVRDRLRRDLALTDNKIEQLQLKDIKPDSIGRYQQAALKDEEQDRLANLAALKDVVVAVKALLALIEDLPRAQNAQLAVGRTLGYGLVQLFEQNYFRLRRPIWHKLFMLLGLMEELRSTHLEDNDRSYETLKAFFRGEKEDPETLRIVAQLVFIGLSTGALFLERHARKHKLQGKSYLRFWNVISGWDASPGSSTEVADRLSELFYSFAIERVVGGEEKDSIGSDAIFVTLGFVPTQHGGPGLLVCLGGSAGVDVPLSERWLLRLESEALGGAEFLFRWAGENKFHAFKPQFEHKHRAILTPNPELGDETLAFPGSTGTRLELGRLSLVGELSKDGGGGELIVEDAALVISGGDLDSLSKEALPADETRISFQLVMGASTKRGLYFKGGVGLDAKIPLGVTIGPATVQYVAIRLKADPAAKPLTVAIETSVALSVKLGPVTASIDRLGFGSALQVGDKANSWDLGVDFLGPTGVGLKVDSSELSGGAYLFHDAERGLYAGVGDFDLKRFGGIALKGIGLLSTRLPNGKKGYSLVIVVTAERRQSAPLGFSLQGVGLLLAIHRTFDEDAVRGSLNTGLLDSVMFPKDPVRDAPKVIDKVATCFPVCPGRHIFGVLLLMTWGPKAPVKLKLALLLEIASKKPRLQRLIVLGQISARLPVDKGSIIDLNIAVLGVVDFTKSTAALDGVLHDSRLCKKFPLTGQMAMRVGWSSPTHFALAVGGFNEAYKPPPNFPKLDRVKINFGVVKHFTLLCEGYLAITPSTLQFGGRALLSASAGGFTLEGELKINGLLEYACFQITIDISARVQLKRGSRNLFQITLEGRLDIFVPMRLHVKATFSILSVDFGVSVNITLIKGSGPPRPAPVDVQSRLVEALSDLQSWSGQIPSDQSPVLSLRTQKDSADTVLLHPLGALEIRQTCLSGCLRLTGASA